MDLIIKPTQLCNFSCTFCSSPDIAESDADIIEFDQINEFFGRFDVSSVIINGGDPLVMSPEWYDELLLIMAKHNCTANISLTTNMWDFCKRPDKWIKLFNHPQISVSTSFHYGDSRRINKDTVYTEEHFWKASDLLLEHVGYRPQFISVITPENLSTAIDNVTLAQKMDVECKLNLGLISGLLTEQITYAQMFELYVEIYNRGLSMGI